MRSFAHSSVLALALVGSLSLGVQAAAAQNTQTVIAETSKNKATLAPSNLELEVNGHKLPVAAVTPLAPADTEVALLIDDGLRTSLGRELTNIQQFITTLRPGTQIMVGYMENGRVIVDQPFTTDFAAAAGHIRLPLGAPGLSASPYICLSDFSKHWPGPAEQPYGTAAPAARAALKHRIVLMITNGVDPYNGSVSPLNQDSPYVQTAVNDAQRASITVYSIYFGDAGIRGGAANFSGQNYLNQIGEATGGQSLYNQPFNPVSLQPYLQQFQQALASSYVLSFDAPTERELSSLKVKATGAKVRAPQAIRPGNAGS